MILNVIRLIFMDIINILYSVPETIDLGNVIVP